MAIAAVAGLASIGSAMIAAGTFAIGWAAAAGAFALGAGLSMVSRALAPKPNIGAQMRGITQTTREPASSRKTIYGRMRVGGQVVFISHSGDDNKYLHMAVAFASHEIESFDEIWFNDKKIWTTVGFQSDWGTYVTIDRKFGTAGQAASTQLTNANVLWTSDHKLSGIAYIAFKLEWNQDKFPQGVPNITAVIKGKKVYDPRTSTTAYSQNPALCLRDYMLDQSYGLGEVAANINDTSVGNAADLCEEQVTLDAGGTQDRYQCNGVIDTANQIKANIEQLLASMGGRLTYSGGEYFVDGAEYKTPTLTFTEADIVSDIQTQTKQSRRGIYNGVKGIFVSEEKNFKVLDYPAQISSTYELEDGDPIYLDMPLPCVTNNQQAQRLAKIALLKSRQQVVMTMTTNLKGLRVKVGDTIRVTNDRLNYSSKVFEVIDYSLAITDGALGVNLSCIEIASAIYDWNTSDEQDFLAGGELDLYDGRTVENVTNLTATEIAAVGPDGTLTTNVELTWTAPDDAFIDFYKVRWNENGTTDYFHAETKETRILIAGLDVTSNYDFRVQVQNLLGVTSTGVSLDDEVLEGDTTAPAVPTIIGTEGGIQTITLTWQNPNDVDFKHVEVFVNSTNSLPANPTSIVDGETYTISGLIGEQTRYFWLKSVDFSSNKSAATTAVSGVSVKVTAGDIEDGAIDIASFASDISPVQVVSSLPVSASEGDIAYLTTDNNLYRYDGTAWTRAVALGDVTGAGNLAALNTVGSSQIDNDAITNAQIAVDAIQGDVIAAGAITSTMIGADAVTTAAIANDAITSDLIAAGAITSTEIGADAVTTAAIANDAITTDLIAAGAITSTEIGADAVTTSAIAANAITATEIAAGAVTANEIAANTITAGQIAAGAVTATEIAANTITSSQIAANTVTASEIAAGAVTANEIAANTITAGEIAAGAVSATEIAANTITSSQIAANAITASEIAAGAITATEIAAGTITSSELAADSVTANAIAAGSVAADEIAAGAVTTAKLDAGAVTANEIAANTITAGQIAAGAISATEISVSELAAISSVLGTLTAGTIDADVVDITNLSVGTADIEDLAVTGAKIGSLAVDTLKIADNAVTIPESAVGTTHSSIGSVSSPTVLLTKTITYDSGAAPEAIMVSGFAVVKSDQSQVGYIKVVLEVAGVDVFTSADTNTTTTTETKAFVHRVTGLTGTSVTIKLKVYRTGSSSNANVYQSGILILGAKK